MVYCGKIPKVFFLITSTRKSVRNSGLGIWYVIPIASAICMQVFDKLIYGHYFVGAQISVGAIKPNIKT